MKTYKIYAGGKFITTTSELKVSNSFTQETFAKTFFADTQILENAIIAADNAKQAMKELSSFRKIRYFDGYS